MNDTYFKKIMTTVILVALIALTFFLLKPILMAIIVGVILAFVFNPVYEKLTYLIKSKNLSAFLICILLIILILLPIWFLTPLIIEQSFKFYLSAQQIDFVSGLKKIFPSFFASDAFSQEIGSILSSFTAKTANSLTNSLTQIILNFPTWFLQFSVIFFTLFFVLRDKDLLLFYIKSLSPFSKDVEDRLFESSKGITSSVIYGQVIVGLVQGIIAGIGFFLFSAPNNLLLTLLAVVAGIFPIIGTALIWIPVAIYFLISGNVLAFFGITFFGLISSTVDNFLRPMIVSRKTKIHSSVVLIGMIGGLFFFGILGFILGPLVLSYLLIVLDIYRDKKFPEPFITHSDHQINIKRISSV